MKSTAPVTEHEPKYWLDVGKGEGKEECQAGPLCNKIFGNHSPSIVRHHGVLPPRERAGVISLPVAVRREGERLTLLDRMAIGISEIDVVHAEVVLVDAKGARPGQVESAMAGGSRNRSSVDEKAHLSLLPASFLLML